MVWLFVCLFVCVLATKAVDCLSIFNASECCLLHSCLLFRCFFQFRMLQSTFYNRITHAQHRHTHTHFAWQNGIAETEKASYAWCICCWWSSNSNSVPLCDVDCRNKMKWNVMHRAKQFSFSACKIFRNSIKFLISMHAAYSYTHIHAMWTDNLSAIFEW